MLIITFFSLLVFSAFFSITETSFFSLSQGQVKLMQQKNKKNADLVAKLKSEPQRLLATILICNNVINMYTASLATVAAIEFLGASSAVGIATGLSTFFILVFAEIVPKSIAITHARGVSQVVARPIYVFFILLYPISTLVLYLNKLLARWLHKSSDSTGVTEEEIRILTRMSVESGHIEYREREMIENIFRFNDTEVGDIMTPLYKVELLDGDVPVDQIAYFVSQSGHSRFPVYEDDADDIIGYIHVNTIMRVLNSDDRDHVLKEYVVPILRVDEKMKLERVFRSMTKEKAHLYLVHKIGDVNDVVGLITLEDLLEEIVGEIEDETDKIDEMKRRI
jgi:CBS domain containing-hemolysin-like protein